MSDVHGFKDADFAKFLLNNQLIRQGSERFFVYWVRIFHKLRVQWPGYDWHDQIPLFLKHLGQSENISDWQTNQFDFISQPFSRTSNLLLLIQHRLFKQIRLGRLP